MEIRPDEVRLQIPELRWKVDALMRFGEGLANNLEVASRAFDSANFVKARAFVMKSLQGLYAASGQLERGEKYVSELLSLCEEYLKLGFKG